MNTHSTHGGGVSMAAQITPHLPTVLMVVGVLAFLQSESYAGLAIGGAILGAGLAWMTVRIRRQRPPAAEVRLRIGTSAADPPRGREGVFVALGLLFLLLGVALLFMPMREWRLSTRLMLTLPCFGLGALGLMGLVPRATEIAFGVFAASFLIAGLAGMIVGVIEFLEPTDSPTWVPLIKAMAYGGLLVGVAVVMLVGRLRGSTPITDDALHSVWGPLLWTSLKGWRLEEGPDRMDFVITLPNDY